MMTHPHLLLIALAACASSLAQPITIANPGFEEEADGKPAGWTLSGGQGAWDTPGRASARCVSVTAESGSNFWRTEDLAFPPGGLYRVSVWMKSAPGTSGGCIVTGPPFANRDYSVGEAWEQKSFVFSVPEAPRNQSFLRFGQWEMRGTVSFDDVSLVPVQALHKRVGGIELGAGESIDHGQYRARLRFDYEGSNYARCLYANNAGFNSNRWLLSGDASVTYRHHVGDCEQTAGRLKVNCGWYASGLLVAEASRDAQEWTEVGRLDAVGTIEAPLPESLFPSRDIYVRLRCEGSAAPAESPAPGNLQVHGYEYVADVKNAPPDFQGQTSFLELLTPNPAFAVTSLGDLVPGGNNAVGVLVQPDGADAELRVAVAREGGKPQEWRLPPAPAREPAPRDIPYNVDGTGSHTLTVTALRGGEVVFAAEARFNVPDMYAADYGYLVSEDDGATVWWCEGPYKVSRERPVPQERKPTMLIEAARNEYEAAQVVVRPARDLKGLTATASDLAGPRGATIPAADVTIDEVAYVNIRIPTDSTGCEGWWPDPLPPLKEPIDLAAGRNQPLWITAHVPKDVPGGDYQGTITLAAQGWRKEVDLRLHVFDFTLPDETHVESGFGLSAGPLREYHNLETNEEVKQVFELYLRNFAAHRISPYNPTPFDPIRVTFTGVTWEGGTFVTDDHANGRASVKIVDDSDSQAIDAHNRDLIPVDPQKAYILRWACRTLEPNQDYLVTLQTYDANRQWISGNNKDFQATGSGEWLTEERDLTGPFDDRVRFVQLVLRPATWTEDGSKTGTAWFDDCEFAAKDDGKNLLPNPGFETTDEQLDVAVDFTDWDKAAAHAFNDLHLRNFSLPVQGMGGGTFHSRHLGRIGPYEQGTPEYERIMTKYLTTIQNHLEEKGWLDKQYIYWFDEPDVKDYDFVRDGMEMLKRCGPKLRRMLTEEPVPPLFGAVDLWCPVLPNMDPDICAQRKKLGEDIWWYVCTGPKAPFPTLFIDHSATEMRVWLWMTWKWNLDGVLIWATNYWHSPAAYYEGKTQNPWEDPMSYVSGYDYKPGQIGYWGNGDGRFLYPPNRQVGEDKTKYLEGPVNCLRWEILRDGIEDYEYLYLLRSLTEKGGAKAKEAAKLLEVPESIVQDKTHFTRDPLPILEQRRKVARAIEELQ
jgi:hypothetical protein